MRPRRPTGLLLAAWAFLVLGGTRLRAEDAPPPGRATPPLPALAEFAGDPEGEVTRRDREATERLTGSPSRPADPVGAAEAWMDLADADPAALLPAPPESGAPDALAPTSGLWWPARAVALARLAALPEPGRVAVETRWGTRAQAALASGVFARLEALAEEAPVTAAGGTALLLLADRDLEAGRIAAAIRRLDAWWRLQPRAPASRRAAVLARLVEACVALRDENGILLLARRAVGLDQVPIVRPEGTRTLAEHVAQGLRSVRGTVAAEAAASGPAPRPPARTLGVLWARSTGDAGLLALGDLPGDFGAPQALATAGEAIYVAQARRVRRFDAATGLCRWTFPDGDRLRREHAYAERYRPWEGPVRDVTPAGSLVLATLGDPPMPATSMFLHRGAPVRPLATGREQRTRLVALDAATGAWVWGTGAPTETHPVLRAADVAVSSAPVVAGDRVYVALSARRGHVEVWLACLDRTTGRPHFVTALGRGESTLVREVEWDRVLFEPVARSVPRAGRPGVGSGEVCVATGAGFCAAVDARTGALRWARALPAYRHVWTDDPIVPLEPLAHDTGQGPLPALGTWYVAAPDAPTLASIEAGSGRLRWVAPAHRAATGPAGVEASPSAAHLVGLGVLEDGRSVLRLSGRDGGFEARDAATGAWRGVPRPPLLPSSRLGESRGGRPWTEGDLSVAADGGGLRSALWPRATPAPPSPPVATPVDRARIPTGEVARVGPLWIVLGEGRLLALAEPSVAADLARGVARDPADAAARACVAARLEPTVARFAEAVRRAEAPGAAEARELLAEPARVVLDAVRRSPADLRALLATLDALPAAERGTLRLAAARTLLDLGADADLVAIADDWIARGVDDLVATDGSGDVLARLDLHAITAFLPEVARSPEGRAALAARERRAAEALASPGAQEPVARLEELTRWAGTEAAWAARVRLVGACFDTEQAPPLLAGLAADTRLAPAAVGPAAAPTAGALMALEAEAIARGGDRDRARQALHAARALGRALAREATGVAGARLERALWQATAFVPRGTQVERRLGCAPGGPPTAASARHGAHALRPTGPGEGPELARAVVLRGGDAVVLDLETGKTLDAETEEDGTLGVVWLDREACVPGPGVRVGSVVGGGPSDVAGLREGDWVLTCDGAPVPDREWITRRSALGAPGTRFRFGVLREGEPLVLEVPLARRGAGDRRHLQGETAHVDLEGGWTVPSWLGLRRVEPRSGASTRRWLWDGEGRVVGATFVDARAWVWTSQAPLGDGWIVAIDLRTGEEAWRRALPGRLLDPPRLVGSALVLDATDEDRTWILDARTGQPRAAWRRADARWGAAFAPLPTSSTAPVASSVDAGGCVHLLRSNAGDGTVWWTSVDPGTGSRTWARLAHDGAGAWLMPPLLAGGSVVALASTAGEVQVAVPDLRGGLDPSGPLHADAARFEAAKWGNLDGDARLVAAGDFVHVLRVSPERRASIGTIEVDRLAARDRVRGDPDDWHPARAVLVSSHAPTGTEGRPGSWPLLLAARATLDGAWVVAGFQDTGGGPTEGRTVWFEPSAADILLSFPTTATTATTDPPVRVGRRALLHSEDGFLVVPLVPREPAFPP